jgi:hypothetical protein
MFKHHFPVAKPTVSKRDLKTTADNFAEIAAGKVAVE